MTVASKTGKVTFEPSEYYLVLSQDTFSLDKNNAFVGGSTLTVTAKKRTDAVAGVSSGEVLITVTPDSGTARTSTTGSLSFSVTSAMTKITVTLTDTGETVTHDQRTVMVVKDGKDGATGETGATGASFYMAGTYDPDTNYTRNSFKAPVVQLDGLYYGQKKVGTITGVNPKTDVANNGGNWEVFDMFKYIFSEVAFILFGKLGSSIFNGDFMFSQYGINSLGVQNQEYKNFDPSLSDPTTNTNFMPNILMNMLTGKAWFNDVHVKGDITAGSLAFKTIEGNDGSVSMEGYTFAKGPGVYTLPNPKGLMQVYAFSDWYVRAARNFKMVATSPNKIVVLNSEYVSGYEYVSSLLMADRTLYKFTAIPDSTYEYVWLVTKENMV